LLESSLALHFAYKQINLAFAVCTALEVFSFSPLGTVRLVSLSLRFAVLVHHLALFLACTVFDLVELFLLLLHLLLEFVGIKLFLQEHFHHLVLFVLSATTSTTSLFVLSFVLLVLSLLLSFVHVVIIFARTGKRAGLIVHFRLCGLLEHAVIFRPVLFSEEIVC